MVGKKKKIMVGRPSKTKKEKFVKLSISLHPKAHHFLSDLIEPGYLSTFISELILNFALDGVRTMKKEGKNEHYIKLLPSKHSHLEPKGH